MNMMQLVQNSILIKVNGYRFRESNVYFHFCLTSHYGSSLKRNDFCECIIFERAALSEKANRRSQKLAPFESMAEKDRGVPTYLKLVELSQNT